MNLIFSCFQKIFDIIFRRNKLPTKQQAARKYSNIDITPPLGTISARSINNNEISMTDLQERQQLPSQYNQLTNQQIFIKPSVDVQTNQSNPGTLCINNCQNCNITIMRNLSNVYIDGCRNSSIFIGPCHSTLFIRNCKRLRIRALAQQLRIENSSHITVQGIVGVKPVLEDCRLITFSTLACRMYEDLLWQIQVTKIDIFDNQIYECYDFTPKKQPNFTNIDYQYQQNQLQNQENIQENKQIFSQKLQQPQQKQKQDQDHTKHKQSQRQKQIIEWNRKIRKNQLDWGLENVYLPDFTSTKKSMLKKLYNQIQIRNNLSINVIYTKMNFKQFLVALNSKQLNKNFIIIKKFNIENSLKTLRSYSNFYKQKLTNLQLMTGNWYFLMIKFNKPKNKKTQDIDQYRNKTKENNNSQTNLENTNGTMNFSGIGIGFVQQRELIWRLFNSQQYYQ